MTMATTRAGERHLEAVTGASQFKDVNDVNTWVSEQYSWTKPKKVMQAVCATFTHCIKLLDTALCCWSLLIKPCETLMLAVTNDRWPNNQERRLDLLARMDRLGVDSHSEFGAVSATLTGHILDQRERGRNRP